MLLSDRILVMRILVLLLSLSALSCTAPEAPLTVTFTGDIILDRGVNDELRLHGDSLFINSVSNFATSDFFVVNYEGTFTDSLQAEEREYHLRAAQKKATLLKKSGITHVSVANNHSFDFGEKGFSNTVANIEANEIGILGKTSQAEIISKGAFGCAVIAASLSLHNEGFAISSAKNLTQAVKTFQSKNSKIPLILYLHWGHEYQKTPQKWQRNLAKELVELGADAIIGHHPHVVQSVEYIGNVPVFYSIGNFVADAYLPNTDRALTVTFSVSEGIDSVKVRPIHIKRYFPVLENVENKFNHLHNTFSTSRNISLLEQKNAWLIKKTSEVNFEENTKIWLSFSEETGVAVKRLAPETHAFFQLNSGKVSNSLRLFGTLSEVQLADIDNNGQQDIMFGIAKKVNFDQVHKKRINLFSYQNNNLQALWLGTKFIHDVVSFDVEKQHGKNYLTTVEQDSTGQEYYRKYEWDVFGFGLVR